MTETVVTTVFILTEDDDGDCAGGPTFKGVFATQAAAKASRPDITWDIFEYIDDSYIDGTARAFGRSRHYEINREPVVGNV